MPLSERDYMRNPAKTRAEQRQRRPGFSMPPLLSRSPAARSPAARGERASPEKRPRLRRRDFSEQRRPISRPRRHLGIAFAVAIVSAGIVGAFVVVAVRELL